MPLSQELLPNAFSRNAQMELAEPEEHTGFLFVREHLGPDDDFYLCGFYIE